ncbi:MAG: DivIVA domain-containing protein [Bacillota bacterium]
MIKPIDIQEKEFTRAVRGYKEEEVNEFLDEITVDLDSLLNELRETKEENGRLVEELERIRNTEGNVVETLQAAKSLMTDIASSAEKRAEILLKNAELDAELMIKNAREEAETLAKENQNIRARYTEFRNRYKKMLETELQRFESSRGEEITLSSILDFEDLPVAEDEKPLETVVTQDTIHSGKL